MKRELAFALGVQSQLDESLGPTQIDTRVSDCMDDASQNGFCKRLKGSVVNGLIVYTRERRSQINLCNGFSANEESQKSSSLEELEIGGKSSIEEVKKIEEVETLVIEEHPSNLEIPICENVPEIPALKSPVKREAEEAAMESANDEVARKDFPGKAARRASAEKTGTVEEEDILGMDAETATPTPKYKVEMRMVKRSTSSKRLMTVRELFDTGFLEGVPVVYIGTGKVVVISNSIS